MKLKGYSGEVLGGEESVPIPDAMDPTKIYNSIDIHIPDIGPPNMIRAYVDTGETIERADSAVKVVLTTSMGLIDDVQYIKTRSRNIKVHDHDLIEE
jgi:hypothetical protein